MVPASWVAGDEVYGADPKLRQALQDRRIGYVLAWDATGRSPLLPGRSGSTRSPLSYRRGPGTGCPPAPVQLDQLVRVAGWRWTVEESFQTSKGLTGLDQHQVRTWTSWHRWITLFMAAHAFLAVHTATERSSQAIVPGLIRLSINEFRNSSRGC